MPPHPSNHTSSDLHATQLPPCQLHTNIPADIVQSSSCTPTSTPTTSTPCPLIVKTSKQWVLPPRPKPGRKPIPSKEEKEAARPKQKKQPKKATTCAPRKQEKKLQTAPEETSTHTPAGVAHTKPDTPAVISSLHRNIKLIDSENLALKSDLLSLIHDYKHLKDLVLNKGYYEAAVEEEDLEKNVHKRSYNELAKQEEQPVDELTTKNLMNELINDMNDLSYGAADPNVDMSSYINYKEDKPRRRKNSSQNRRKFNHYRDFDKLDTVEDSDVEINFEDDEDEDEDEDAHSPHFSSESSTGLSRTTSPSSDFENNSLMSTLTRSTTVSSVNTITNQFSGIDKKSSYPFKNSTRFFELPKYEEGAKGYFFQFDDAMNRSSTSDQYNMINDFLEEKLLTNDLKYYEENSNDYETQIKW